MESINEEPSENFIPFELASQVAIRASTDTHLMTRTTTTSNLTFPENKTIKSTFPVKDENLNIVYYIINYNEGGFIIISADNRTEPILAYSDKNEFPTDKPNFPSGLISWMSNAKDSIKTIRKKKAPQPEFAKKQWNNYTSSLQVRGPVDPFDPSDPKYCPNTEYIVGPLLTTQWHQGYPYNAQLRELNCSGRDEKALAGCVPIAIAQVMYYHRYPTKYNWDEMISIYTPSAAALLIKDIHTSIGEVTYSCTATGVSPKYDTGKLFRNSFNYKSATKADYNYQTVQSELTQKRPVILSGGRNEGWWIFGKYEDGHAWVCDGYTLKEYCLNGGSLRYSTLMFHMNWGWGGGITSYDGWYGFNNFNPGNSTYNYKPQMVYNIKP